MKRSAILLFSLLVLSQIGCPVASALDIRPAAVAGKFYASDSTALRLGVTRYLRDAIPPRPGKALALIVPHAGYLYCGQIIADAMNQVAGQSYDLIIILGTNHTTPGFRGVSVYPAGAFQTPLGVVAVDSAAANRILRADKEFTSETAVHEREHSIEVELPFVQVLFPHAAILPIIIGEPDLKQCRNLGTALASVIKDRKSLLIASSDLSHYPSYDDAEVMDAEVLKKIVSLDPEALQQTVHTALSRQTANLETCACGEGPILTAMIAAKALGAEHGAVISYANSGDASLGDYDRVVGYGAAVLQDGIGITDTSIFQPQAREKADVNLSSDDKSALLKFARQSLEWYLTSGTLPLARGFGNALMANGGAFVTLKERGELRGCIGHMADDMPLGRTVGAMTMAAAFQDGRFRPVDVRELPDIEIEISVLSPLRIIADPSQIVLGRDGILIRKTGKSAVYLPQIATEQGWSRDEMLDHLCEKAGLTAGSWKENTEFRVFQADVFSENAH